jgi:hypothetical protein
MNIDDLFPSRFLKATELPEGELPVQIDYVQTEEMQKGGEEKPVVYFVGGKKGLVLNKTNKDTIKEVFGGETDGWRGKNVVLYTTTVTMQGRQVLAIRVRVPRQRPPAAVVPTPAPASALLQEAASSDIPAELPF